MTRHGQQHAADGRPSPLLLRALTMLAQELAEKAGPHGVTASDLRLAAARKSPPLVTNNEAQQRALSFLPTVFRAAGLVAKTCPCCKEPLRRESDIPRSRHNPNVVYVLPEYSTPRASGAS